MTTEPKAGDTWRFRCRPHEEDGQVTIHRVEGDTAHVGLTGVRVFNGTSVGTTVGDLPLSRGSLRQSVVALIEEGVPEPASFREGYDHWKSAKGGVWSAPLSEVLNSLERVMSNPEALLDHAIRTMRELRTDEGIQYAMRAAIVQPTLCFIRSPDEPSQPLLWKYDGYPVCIPMFTSEDRASHFAREANLVTPSFIVAPATRRLSGSSTGWVKKWSTRA